MLKSAEKPLQGVISWPVSVLPEAGAVTPPVPLFLISYRAWRSCCSSFCCCFICSRNNNSASPRFGCLQACCTLPNESGGVDSALRNMRHYRPGEQSGSARANTPGRAAMNPPQTQVIDLASLANQASTGSSAGAVWSLASADLNLNLLHFAAGDGVEAHSN